MSSTGYVSSDAERTLAHWVAFARHTPMGLVLDLDGTLIPFAPTPGEARPGPGVVDLVAGLAALEGISVAVVSGRRREDLDQFFGQVPRLLLVAEHGAWRRGEGAWQTTVEGDIEAIERLASNLERIASLHPGALVERKSWSVAFHVRRVAPKEKEAALVAAAAAARDWSAEHPGFEPIDGAEVMEIRPSRVDKSLAVFWLRDRLGQAARLLVLGDDLSDEDAFRALGPADEGVLVGREPTRSTAARSRLDGPAQATAFLEWFRSARAEDPTPSLSLAPSPISPRPSRTGRVEEGIDLLVLSNRLPELRSPTSSDGTRPQRAGGLVSALEPVLSARHGVWLGWSGRVVGGEEPDPVRLGEEASPRLAWIDMPASWKIAYYDGFCNRTLWPLLHTFPERMRLGAGEWEVYQRANAAFARAALDLAGQGGSVWAHDYHLLLAARELRRMGHRGPIGLFLHVPFPGSDVLGLLPWADRILDAMLDFDLLGFHTPGYVENFRQCVGTLSPARVGDDAIEHRGRRVRIGAFPIGIVPGGFQEPPEPESSEELAGLLRTTRGTRLVLGVDRLDYTKGIPERLLAFGRLFERAPDLRGRVSLIQVSVPSRADVPEYTEQRARVETIVGRINGELGRGSWVPIRYLYRAYRQDELAVLYRAADVGYVTPLRDGMNLVAKEFIAAQDAANPGVLLVSRFAGAAVELRDALLCNPWHVDGLADDLGRALAMPLEERQARHRQLLAAVEGKTAMHWAESFLSCLNACR